MSRMKSSQRRPLAGRDCSSVEESVVVIAGVSARGCSPEGSWTEFPFGEGWTACSRFWGGLATAAAGVEAAVFPGTWGIGLAPGDCAETNFAEAIDKTVRTATPDQIARPNFIAAIAPFHGRSRENGSKHSSWRETQGRSCKTVRDTLHRRFSRFLTQMESDRILFA